MTSLYRAFVLTIVNLLYALKTDCGIQANHITVIWPVLTELKFSRFCLFLSFFYLDEQMAFLALTL